MGCAPFSPNLIAHSVSNWRSPLLVLAEREGLLSELATDEKRALHQLLRDRFPLARGRFVLRVVRSTSPLSPDATT
jgi:hypothetical protein